MDKTETEKEASPKVEAEAQAEAAAEVEIENEDAYPPPKVVLPAMVAIYLAVFLIALVRYPFFLRRQSIPSLMQIFRIEPSSEQPFHPSQMNSKALGTLHGTRRVFCCLFACFS